MKLRHLAGTSAFVVLMSSSALWADVTPEQVWQGWQDAATGMDNAVKADSATRDGDTLVVTNIVITDATGGAVTIETISFTDQGDGTVAVEMPDTYPIKVAIPAKPDDPTSKPVDLTIDVSMPDATIVASGTPEAINYKTDAPSVDLKLSAVDGTAAETVNAKVEAKLKGLALDYTMTPGDLQTYVQEFSLKSADITAKGSDPATGSDFDMTASVADMSNSVNLAVPKDIGMADTAAMMAKGLAMTGSFGFGATTLNIKANDAGKPTTINAAMASGTLDLTLDKTKLDYATNTKGVSLKVASPDIPVADASLSYGEAGFHLLVPVEKSDTPADFTFLVTLADLAMAEDIWALIDPTKALKHDPATVVIDTKGKITMLQDLMTDAQMGMSDTAQVAQINALDVTNVNIKAAGAEVSAQGAFTFDPSDITTFNGVPAPTGKIDIKATGVNALIDTLVTMGLVPQDQAMQGRMMLSMFANTSATADEMTSTLEFKDKHFFANGQQLQ